MQPCLQCRIALYHQLFLYFLLYNVVQVNKREPYKYFWMSCFQSFASQIQLFYVFLSVKHFLKFSLSVTDTAKIENIESTEQVLLSNTLSNPGTNIDLFWKQEPFRNKAISLTGFALFKSKYSNPTCLTKYDLVECILTTTYSLYSSNFQLHFFIYPIHLTARQTNSVLSASFFTKMVLYRTSKYMNCLIVYATTMETYWKISIFVCNALN